MEYIYSALILHKVGKEINENNLKKILESAGAKVDEAKVKAVVAALSGVDIEKVVKEAAVVPVVKEEKKEVKEEKKEEKKEVDAAAGLGSLFG